MALYTMSDTHLSLSCDKPMDVFGRRWEGYVEKIKNGWNEVIKDEDTVIIAGDVSWGMSLDESLEDFRFLQSLPGKKILAKGNHDYWWDTVTKMKKYFVEHDITGIDFLHNNSYLIEGIAVCGSRGWFNDKKQSPSNTEYSKIVNREAMRVDCSIKDCEDRFGKKPKVFLHFPPVYRDFLCREIIDVLLAHNIEKCYYGHIHNNYDIPASFNYEGIDFIITSADYLDFKPIKVED